MAFGKLNTTTNPNYLMSAEKIPTGETGWLPLTDFVTDGGGEYYSYYIDPGTPDTVKNDQAAAYEKSKLINEAIADVVVTYGGKNYSGSFAAQAMMSTAIVKLVDKPPGTTNGMYTAEWEVVDLTSADFQAILDLLQTPTNQAMHI